MVQAGKFFLLIPARRTKGVGDLVWNEEYIPLLHAMI